MSLRKQALIAGASEGIGAAFAAELAHREYDLWMVARRVQPLEEIQARLTLANPNCKVHLISIDLAQADATEQIMAHLNGTPVDFFVYNAALSFIGAFLSTAIEDQL